MVIDPSLPPQLVGSEVNVTVKVGAGGSVNEINVASVPEHPERSMLQLS